MKRLILIVLLCLSLLPMWAQRDTCFWVAVPSLAQHSSDASMRMYIFAEQSGTEVSVEMPADPSFRPIRLTIDSGRHADLLLAADYAEYLSRLATPHGAVANRALLVRASMPVTCYCQLTGVNGEAFVPRGQMALGTEFCVAMQNRYPNAEIETSVYRDAYCSVQVLATEDSTEVRFPDRTIELQRGQTYSYRANEKSAAAHMSGMQITASRPVSVFSTDDSPSPHPGISGEDAVIDQLLPVRMAGNDYIAVGRGLSWEGCFVQSLSDTTEVTCGDGTSFVLPPYRTRFLPLGKQTQVLRIHSSRPTQVFQITGFWNEMGGVLLPDLFRSGSQVVRYCRMSDSRHTSLNIVMPTADILSLNLPCSWQSVPGDTVWSYAVVDMSALPIDSLLTIRSDSAAFHVGIVDATSAYTDAERPVMTSASYSYFSSYGTSLTSTPGNTSLTSSTSTPSPTSLPSDTSSTNTTSLPSPTGKPAPTHQPAPRDTVRHHLALYGEGAYSQLLLVQPGWLWSRGYSAGLGLVYELEYGHLLFQTGLGVSWRDAQQRVDTQQYTRADEDTQSSDNTVMYRIDRSDRARSLQLDLPLLVGGRWGAFYCLGGVRLGVPVYGNTRMQAMSSTMAQYDQYYDSFTDMDNHGLRTRVTSFQQAARLPYALDTRLHIELGTYMGMRARIAAYSDFGALLGGSMHTDAPMIDVSDKYDMQSWPMTPVLRSNWAKKETHTFCVGLRFTYLLF